MAELKDKFGTDAIDEELVEGSGGVFNVEIDGKLIYNKLEVGDFPRYREIVTKIEEQTLQS